MVEALLVVGAITAVTLPHLVPMRLVSPAVAAATWLAALALRGLIAIGAALFLLLYIPQTDLFRAIAGQCFHAVLPIVATHLGLSGHSFADAAIILPALALSASLLWVGFGLVRAALAFRARLARRALGPGPLGSTVVEEPGVVVAVTGLGRSQVIVSREAIQALDDEELNASLAHEWGHILRRHRPLLVTGSLLAAVGRCLPGTRIAEREFRLSLERDADAYAVKATRDPLALASAICKAAPARPPRASAAYLDGAGSGITARLAALTEERSPRRGLELAGRVLALLLVIQVAALAATIPSWALSRPAATPAVLVDCDDH